MQYDGYSSGRPVDITVESPQWTLLIEHNLYASKLKGKGTNGFKTFGAKTLKTQPW